jgi:hypothetical protein
MAIFGSFPTIRSQLIRHPVFDLSFAYLDDALRAGTVANKRALGVAVGESNRVELGEGAFALEQAYLSKPVPKAGSNRARATSTSRRSSPARN